MSLVTHVTKGNGHLLRFPNGWNWFLVYAMVQAARSNSAYSHIRSIWDWPPHAIVMEHDFSLCDASDRELFSVKKGWKLDAYRET